MLLFVALLEFILFGFTLVAWASGFVVVTALLGGLVESERLRLGLGLLATILAPLLWQARLSRRRPRLVGAPLGFVALCSLAIGIALSLGFADDVGRALRRHGDWFLGERNGAVARATRAGIALVAARLERYDPPRALDPMSEPQTAPGPTGPVLAPQGPGLPPSPGVPDAQALGWYHPLAGAERAMPGSEGRRFGANRPRPRPAECELGHCGVDLGYTLGQDVVAIHDGVIERVEEDESSGGRAGRYVRISHQDGTVVSRYIHLDSIRPDLRAGVHVRGGEIIGRVGRTGVEHSGPHLHFGLSLRPGGGPGTSERYIDPEPLLRHWSVADAPSVSLASLTLEPR